MRGEWIIDEEAAAVVRRIFQSVLAGKTIVSIAKALRTEKIPIPSEHWKRTGKPVRAAKYTDPYAWSATTIGYILKRPEYTGRKVLGKTVCENYKTKSNRKTALEEQEAEEKRLAHNWEWQKEWREKRNAAEPPKPPKKKSIKELMELEKTGAELTLEETERLAEHRRKKAAQHKAWRERQKAHKSRKKIAREKLVQQAETARQRRQNWQRSGHINPKPPRNPGRKCMRKPPQETPKW